MSNPGGMSWDELKQRGSNHYKNGGVEPIDLYRSIGALRAFALCSIIKYAARNINYINDKDMDKIIHYAEMLKAACHLEEVPNEKNS
jgi:hypothetical protein